MFTQCPDCKTVFEVAPADLAVAAGLVRCGECSQTFSALRSLADTPLDFEAPDVPADGDESAAAAAAPVEPAAEDQPEDDTTVEADSRADDGSDDEAGADEDDTDADSVAAVIAAATELARQPADTQPDDAAGTPDGDGERHDSDPADDDPANDRGDANSDETATIASDDDDSDIVPTALDDRNDETADDDDGDDEIVLDEFYEPPGSDDEEPLDDDDEWEPDDDAESEPADESALFALPVPELLATGIMAAATVPEKLEGGEAAIDPFAQDASATGDSHDTQPGRADVAPAPQPAMRGNDAVDAEDARDLSDYLRAPRPGGLVAAGWIGGSLLLALALIGQVLHHNRGDLVLHQRFGPAVKSLYGAVGLEVRPNWRVDDYKIVGQARLIELSPEETGQPPGEYRFVAIIANRADRPQPPPMVRITLRDRWGDPKGVRDFAPPEYLTDRSMVEQLLEPGQRLRVVLNLLGPGEKIDGFDFDMCLPDTDGRLRCSSEPAG